MTRQIPVPSELFDEMEALYAPPDHPVFTLVPSTFNDYVTELYSSMGQPEVTVKTFWDIYRNLLAKLREPVNDQLTNELATFQAGAEQDDDGIALLPDMEPFRLGQPLDLGGRSSYIGGLENSAPVDIDRLGAEFAFFSDEDDSNEDDEGPNM
jgi:hypothetical protein